MIGGTDVSIPTRAGITALDVCVRVIRRAWPESVFEDAVTGAISERYEALSFRRLSELFVYRDRQVADDWEEAGAIPSLKNTMIHLLISPTELTVVVDDPNLPPVSYIVALIKVGLRMDILNLAAKLKEAA